MVPGSAVPGAGRYTGPVSKHVVAVANGALGDGAASRLRQATDNSETVLVAVDGGGRHLLRLGIDPNFVTGDFDSLSEPERTLLSARGATLVPTPDQDYTDLDKALAWIRTTLAPETITVFGATGGRLDHLYSVLSTLVRHGSGTDIRLVDEIGETFVVAGERIWEGDDLPGRTVSLMALGPVENVVTRGLRWPLHGETLAPGVRDGTLNVVDAPRFSVSAGSGTLIVLLHHASAPFTVDVVRSPQERQNLIDLRWSVLRPGQPRHRAFFAGDDAPGTTHWIAVDSDQRVIGCASILEQDGWQLRGMAVDVHWQGKGVGAEIVRRVVDALSPEPGRLWCNARLSAVGFYRNCGFVETGDIFPIEGIGPHVRMEWRP